MVKKILVIAMLSLSLCVLVAPYVLAAELDATTSAAITAGVADGKTSLFSLITDNLGTLFVVFSLFLGIRAVMKLFKQSAR